MRAKPETLAALATGLLLTAAAGGALGHWLRRPPRLVLDARRPGMDGRPPADRIAEAVRIGTIFDTGPGRPSVLPGSWPRFRGPDGANIAPAPDAPLAATWPASGPPLLWAVALGEGYAAPAVSRGRVYVLDYDETRRADLLRCLSLDDGREIWQRGYAVQVKRNHGMSRTVPAVSDRHVVTIGPRGHVMCVAAESGRYQWGIDMERRYGARIPDWYTGQCPLIDGEVAVLAPCGTNAFMLGVDCASGQTVWETAPPGPWKMSHSSVVPAVIGGRRMYVYAAVGGVAGVAADGPERGRMLWRTAAWAPAVIAPSPVVLPDGHIFLTAGYGAGGAVLQVTVTGGVYAVTLERQFKPREGLACEQQTPVYYQGRLFGILPKDAGANRGQFVCADPSGTILWTSGQERRFGFGPFMVAGDRFLLLDDNGVLTMARASAERFLLMAQARVLAGVDSWGPFALAGTRLLLRDSKRLACVELGETGRE